VAVIGKFALLRLVRRIPIARMALASSMRTTVGGLTSTFSEWYLGIGNLH
jgi:hypothetical protein